ncbi:HAMP domain-containing histidine kinase [Budviciaceae bacterium BWR-B9]|uniref:histidine kinase n=1 Tax=Limnobaculum allomyrinae TaxID=2791986 RepID=A0ABS1IQR9_9GAMM|nr:MULTISPECIES: HAMP domain-containing sensor histidine kinase [Limnobaculum]MBK5143907.1 HAMP domain-containing histidine kinase [Limnobaculum allomyrinae]MBV7691566.1 HAMP domain-containing histidine kinase [Limnobaculum sp. M2-1]
MNIIKSCWRWLLRPTLVRRLLFWQMLLLILVWSFSLMYSMTDDNVGSEFPKLNHSYILLTEIAEQLADTPDKQQQFIQRFDLALQQDYGGDIPGFAYRIIVWNGDKLLYRSPELPADLHYQQIEQFETLCSPSDNSCWNTYTRQQPESNIRVTFLASKLGGFLIYSTIHTKNFYLLPLITSLPLLLFPAWLTVYLGLRPLNKVIHEISQRGPGNLNALLFRPKHKELATIVDSINILLHRLRTSNARERSFIADAAHELRTPLAAMHIHVEALGQQVKDIRSGELLTGILSSTQRATRLVSQLLNLMRNDVIDKVSICSIDLETLLQERLAILSNLAWQKGIELELLSEQSLFIDGYREGVISLIDNLVENAIKYSPSESTVTVSLQKTDNNIELCVKDQGPGIPPALRERVFSRFFRAPDQSENGSGLGLAIVHAVVLQHQGAIELTNRQLDGSGLKVTVLLPAALPPVTDSIG